MKDLIILVADKTMEFTLRAGLGRHLALGIRPISFDMRQHPNRDGGARTTGAQMLALERARFAHALLMLDYEGSGTAGSALQLEQDLDEQLASTWGARSKAIVIEPELDTWAWGADNVLAQVFTWPRPEPICEWLTEQEFEFLDGKPSRPKEALEVVFQICGWPRSAANYRKIVERISLAHCQDPAFARLKSALQLWFPAP